MNETSRLWHEQNRMPKNPTDDQRVAWHIEHAKHCQCRPIPDRIASLIRAKELEDREESPDA